MKKLRITIGKKSYEVTVEDLTEEEPRRTSRRSTPSKPTTSSPPVSAPSLASKPHLPIATGSITSPMAGSVQSILVRQGDEVKQGQALLILEAMKMENQITAPVAGTVKSVDVKEGESVLEGHVLLVLR
jgi:glutaconyl-CoA decarboxylase